MVPEFSCGKIVGIRMDTFLIDRYGYRLVYDADSCVDAKLSSIIREGE
jgi:hypothetical protein